MKYHQLKKTLTPMALAIVLSGCPATLLTYKPTVNPNVQAAMQTIRDKILTQPDNMAPLHVEVTEDKMKIKGKFEGAKIPREKSPKSMGLYFSSYNSAEYQEYQKKKMQKLKG